jgi:elongation factor Ts
MNVTITATMVKQLRQATGAGPLDCKKALEANDGDFERAAEYLREKGLARAAKKAGRETEAGLVVVRAAGGTACAVEVDCETDFVARTDNFKTFVHRAADQVLADPNLTGAEQLLAADFIDTPGKPTADAIQELVGRMGENIILRRVARYTSHGAGVVESYIHAGALEGYYDPMEGRIGVLVELGVSDATATDSDSDALRSLAHDLALQIAAGSPSYLSPDDVPDAVVEKERDILMAQLDDEDKPDHIKARIVEGRLNRFYQEACLLKQAFVRDDSVSIEQLLQQKGEEFGASITINRFARLEVGT